MFAKSQYSEAQALERLMQLCAQAEHCRREMVDKCLAWGLSSEVAERIVGQLEAERFVDDRRYAPIYVRDKARFAGWGPMKVRAQLRAKGVESDVADDAIAAFDAEEWDAILLRAVRAKARTVRQADKRKVFASLVRFAMQRGFAYEAAKFAAQEVMQGVEPDGNDDSGFEADFCQEE